MTVTLSSADNIIDLRKLFKARTAMIFAVQVGDQVGASRALGALLCIACVVIAILHIFYGYYIGPRPHLAFGLPITVGLLVVVGLGFWLGWIMATTKEVSPAVTGTPPATEPTEEEEE